MMSTQQTVPAHKRNRSAFDAWLQSAQPGDRIIYFTGVYLIHTRTVMQVRDAYDRGEIEMIQRRDAAQGRGFEYIAVKRAITRPPRLRLVDRLDPVSRA